MNSERFRAGEQTAGAVQHYLMDQPATWILFSQRVILSILAAGSVLASFSLALEGDWAGASIWGVIATILLWYLGTTRLGTVVATTSAELHCVSFRGKPFSVPMSAVKRHSARGTAFWPVPSRAIDPSSWASTWAYLYTLGPLWRRRRWILACSDIRRLIDQLDAVGIRRTIDEEWWM